MHDEEKIAWICKQSTEIKKALNKRDHVGRTTTVSYMNILVRWQLPAREWLVLNIDASFNRRETAGGGIVVRKFKGKWIAGAMLKYYAHNATEAECRIIITGINRVWNKGWKMVTILKDSETAINWITRG